MFADLILAVALLLLGVLASWQTRRLSALSRGLVLEKTARVALEAEMRALLECSRALGDRVREQHARQLALDADIKVIGRSAGASAPLHDVARLMNQGVDVGEVAALCELSQGEAALLSRWRARRAAA